MVLEVPREPIHDPTLAAGTPNNMVRLDGLGRLPALDGSLLFNLPGGSGSEPVVSEDQAPLSNGQTVFSLSNQPKSADAIWITFNRSFLVKDKDYTVSGGTNQTVTFTAFAPAVKTTDEIRIYYQRL